MLGRETAGGAINADGFRAFEGAAAAGAGPNGRPNTPPRLAKKPLVIFLLTVVGLPWLMTRLVRLITARQDEEARLRALNPDLQPQLLLDQFGRPLPNQPLAPPVDPSSLTFVRAAFPYAAADPAELSFDQDSIIAVLTPVAERTTPGWWRGRLRDGTIGFFPSTHVEELPVKGKTVEAKEAKVV